jgi:tetratricopeptide (TPR) repeat protein
MKCHAANLTAQIALHRHTASNDCVSCHMPKRRSEDVVHAIMTDHLIQRRPPPAKELLAERQEIQETPTNAYLGEVKRYLPDHERPGPTDDLYDALAQVIDSSNLEAGIPRLEEAIRTKRPDQPNFLIELGDAKRHSGDLSGAIGDYRQALILDPLSSRAQRRLGTTLGSIGQQDEALAVLQRAIEHEPDNALLWYEQALIESRGGKRERAIEHFRKALELKPDFADAQNNLGTNLAQIGDQQGAEVAFRAALATNPYDGGPHANLGRLLAGKGDWNQAVFHLKKATELDPVDVNARMAYAVVLLQMHRLPEAEKQAETAVKVDPKSVQAEDLLILIQAQRASQR